MIKLMFLLSFLFGSILAFSPPIPQRCAFSLCYSTLQLFAEKKPPSSDDDTANSEGSDLAAQFFKLAKEKNIELEDDYDVEDENDEDLDENDDGDDFDIVDVETIDDSSSGANDRETEFLDNEERKDSSLTDYQIDKETKERILETAGGFVEYVSKISEDDEGGEEKDDQKEYKVPTKYPDAELTAGEVVELILNALSHNDNPTENKGIEIFFAYFSDNNQIKQIGLSHEEYAEFLKGDDTYNVVFNNLGIRIEKGEYNKVGSKAFYSARVQTGPASSDYTLVNFILSSTNDDNCWFVDSMLIRPKSLRRRSGRQ
mmetsp:Transcript_30314/g.34560  ORF Transcript_30314/g.34560 Transcript_30314/m.34560 type:complete len:315 (+) Transcript_30314:63-1007(+)